MQNEQHHKDQYVECSQKVKQTREKLLFLDIRVWLYAGLAMQSLANIGQYQPLLRLIFSLTAVVTS